MWTFELLKLEYVYIVQQNLLFQKNKYNPLFCDITPLNGFSRKQAHERIDLIPESGLEHYSAGGVILPAGVIMSFLRI